MVAASSKGHAVTLKVMVRKKDAGGPYKFMGHGICDNFARSANFPGFTNDSDQV